jgi:hypothetical protein
MGYKLKRVDSIHGKIKATFIINNLTSEEFLEDLDYSEIEQRINTDLINKDRKVLYIKALDAIREYENNLLRMA